MPALQLPLRQYPSAQTMRPVNGSYASVGPEAMHQSRANEAYCLDRPSDRPSVNDPDFQANPWSPSRRPSTPKPVGSPRLQANGDFSPLDSHRNWTQNTPTMSRSGFLTHRCIVVELTSLHRNTVGMIPVL